MKPIRHPLITLAESGGWTLGHTRSWSWRESWVWSNPGMILVNNQFSKSWTLGLEWSLRGP